MESDSNQEESKNSLRLLYNHDQLIVDTTPYEQRSSARNSATTPTTNHRKRPLSQGRKIISLPKTRPSVGQEFFLKPKLSIGKIFVQGKQSYEASLLEKISNQKNQIGNLQKELKTEEKLVKTLMTNPDNYATGRFIEKVKKWKNIAKEKDNEIKQKEKDLDELKKNSRVLKVCELKTEIDILSKICKNLESQLNTKAIHVKTMHEDEKKIELKLKEYENDLHALKAENKEIITNYLQKDSIILDLKSKVDKLSKKKLVKRNQALKKEIERLKLKLEGNPFAIASNHIEKHLMVIDIQKPPIIYRNKIEKNLMIHHIKNIKINDSKIQRNLLITNINRMIKKQPDIQRCVLNVEIKPICKNEKVKQGYGNVYDSKNQILKLDANCSSISIIPEISKLKSNLDSNLKHTSPEKMSKPEDFSVQLEHFSLSMAVEKISKFDVPEHLFGEAFDRKMNKDELMNHLKSLNHVKHMPNLESFCEFLIEPTKWNLSEQNSLNTKTAGQICAKLLACLSNWEIVNDNEVDQFNQFIKRDLIENMDEFKTVCKKGDPKRTGCIEFDILEKNFKKFLVNPSRKLLYYIKVSSFAILSSLANIPYNNVCLSIENMGKNISEQELLPCQNRIDDHEFNKISENENFSIEHQFASKNFEDVRSINEDKASIKQQITEELPNHELLQSEYIKENIEVEENKSEESCELEQKILEKEKKEELKKTIEENIETQTVEMTKEITESDTEFQHEDLSHLCLPLNYENKNYEASSNRKRKIKDEYEIRSRPESSFESNSQTENETSKAEDEEDYDIA